MKWETLYKRAKTGAIVYYDICVLTADGQPPLIEKFSGQLGTNNPIVHREKVLQGKNLGKSNETTPQQQAELQAASDWRRKLDDGYKSLNDLGICKAINPETSQEYYTKISDEGPHEEYTTLNAVLQFLLPQFNTDAQGNVKPMLAMDWKKVKTIPYPVYIQPKLDGVRCLMIVNEPEVTFLSRSGKTYTTLGHIANDVFEAYAEDKLHGNFILDGEIYSDELSFQEITQAVKKQYPNSLKLHFRAYDVVTDHPYSRRNAETEFAVKSISSPHIHLVPTQRAFNSAQVEDWHNMYVQSGYEGAMLRLPEGKYEQGHRSCHLLKVKEFDEGEFPFSHYEFGQRGVEDLLAVCWTTEKKQFKAKVMGNKAQKEELWKGYGDLKSPVFTVKHFGWTTDKLPRFPIGKAIRDYE